MKTSRCIHFALVAAPLLVSGALAGETNQQYITGSWVNVRAQAAPDGVVIDHVTVNTPVRVANTASGNGFCDITYGADKHGYVACRLLTDKPLTLQEVDTPEINEKPNPAYSATRAFWIQPSVDRLLAAGRYFESTMLKSGEREAEEKAGWEGDKLTKIRRFPIPEFEAMKDRLKNGVLAVPSYPQNGRYELPLQLPKWKAIKAIAADSTVPIPQQAIKDLLLPWGYWETPMTLINELELPITKKSYFRDVGQVLSPSMMTETASSRLGIPYRAVVKSGPTWVLSGHYNDVGNIFGAWDVGAIETSLVSPVMKHTVSRDGTIRSESSNIPGGRFPALDADGNDCNEGFAWGDGDAAIQRSIFGTAKKAGNRFFYFFSKDNLPRNKATVVRSKSKFSAPGFVSAETYRFDVDGDGVDDILVWEGTGISEQAINVPSTAQAYYRIVFFNIDGEWHLFLVDEFVYACGC